MAIRIKEDAPYASFAQRLAGLRKSAKMSRATLAEKCRLTDRAIINYENGSRIPYADTAVRMAQAFGISVEELLGMENPETEMQKASVLDTIRKMYGSTGVKQARSLLDSTDSLLAGGTLTPEQQSDFILEMQKLFIIATEKAKKTYTPKKYRTKEKEEAAEERLQEVTRINSIINDRAALKPRNPFLEDDEFYD